MKPWIRGLVACIAVVGVAGCANLTSPAREHQLTQDMPYWMDYDASRRGSLVIPTGTKVKTCAEPSPDVALTLVSKIEASLKPEAGGELGGKGEFSATVVELAKRTQMVMFLREALFRLCEQSLNDNFKPKEIVDVYKEILTTAAGIVVTDQTNAMTRAQEAQNKALELKRSR